MKSNQLLMTAIGMTLAIGIITAGEAKAQQETDSAPIGDTAKREWVYNKDSEKLCLSNYPICVFRSDNIDMPYVLEMPYARGLHYFTLNAAKQDGESKAKEVDELPLLHGKGTDL